MLIGATLKKEEISYWEPKIPINQWMRIFPNSDGLIPVVSDDRYVYAERIGMRTLFLSSKVHDKYSGTDSAGFDIVVDRLEDLLATGDFDMIYITEHHEPEGDSAFSNAAEYATAFNLLLSKINGMSAPNRAKIKCGPVLTRQYTENTSGREYDDWDPGTGDFFGVDMYANSWSSGSNQATSFPNPVTFCSEVKAYTFDGSDDRPRVFPELGAIGLPFDTDGSARATWLEGIYEEVSTWTTASEGFEFEGFIWYNTEGTSGTHLEPSVGSKRYFQLDRRHTSDTGSYTIINPALPVLKLNEIIALEESGGEEPPPEEPSEEPPVSGTLNGMKASAFIDDFRLEKLNSALWTHTGTEPIPRVTGKDYERGLPIVVSSSISNIDVGDTKKLDLNDSKVEIVVGRWAPVGQCDLYLTQGSGASQDLFGYRYTAGTMLAVAKRGVTEHTSTLSTGWIHRYLRIEHDTVTGRIEWWAGTSLDGSDARRYTPTTWSASTQNEVTSAEIEDMTLTISRGSTAGTSLLISSVNSPLKSVDRAPGYANGHLFRNFSSWHSWNANSWLATAAKQNHEWLNVSAGNSNNGIVDTSATTKVLKLIGDSNNSGTTRSFIRSAIPATIRNVDMEVSAMAYALPGTNSFFGLMWRVSDSNGQRYELKVYNDRMEVVVYIGSSYNASPHRVLASHSVETSEGIQYIYRVSHFNDRITIYRDGEEIMSFTDLVRYIDYSGHVGIDVVGNNDSGASRNTEVYFEYVKVLHSYDDQGASQGITLESRGLGAHVVQGRRDETQVTMQDDYTIVGSLEGELETKFRMVQHFTDYSDTVDQAVIDTATNLARQNRHNLIMWNAFNTTRLSSIYAGSVDSVIDDMIEAVETIPGSVYLAPLPYPNLNLPWSPYSYSSEAGATGVATGGDENTLTCTGAGWTIDQWAGRVVRFNHGPGAMTWRVVASNTASVITFTTPVTDFAYAGSNFVIQATTHGGTGTEYRAAWDYIRARFRSANSKANFVFAQNWTHDVIPETYENTMMSTCPTVSNIDAWAIRVVNQGVRTNTEVWRSPSEMLTGLTTNFYQEMVDLNDEIPMFMLAGCAETHLKYNDFEHAYPGSNPTLENSASEQNDAFDDITQSMGEFTNVKYASFFDPEAGGASSAVQHRSMEFNFALDSASTQVVDYYLPTSGVRLISMSGYFMIPEVGNSSPGASAQGDYLMQIHTDSALLLGIFADATTNGQLSIHDSVGVALDTSAIGRLASGDWVRLQFDVTIDPADVGSHTASVKIYDVAAGLAPGSWVEELTATSLTLGTPHLCRWGAQKGDFAKSIQPRVNLDRPRLAIDTYTETYNKARWFADLFETRGFENITRTILMSADSINDIQPVVGQETTYGKFDIDSRLDASKRTAYEIANRFDIETLSRAHLRPQIRPQGYQESASVGQLEYMRFEENGYAPLVLTPRIGGILLQDFDLGAPTPRAAIEQRQGEDGTRDYTEFFGAKSVSFNLICFEDVSGSAAFYRDVVSAWSHPRRRPTLVYKMRGGDERRVALRPDTLSRPWTVPGVRIGVTETQLQYVAIDGKEFSTNNNQLVLLNDVPTELTTPGTASVSPKLRIYSDSNGCMNPLIVSLGEEASKGNETARIGLGTTARPCYVPPDMFLEIDLHSRTIQLNGLPDRGYSYLRYLSSRAWFRLHPYYNDLVFQTEDGYGFATVTWQNGWL